MEIVQGVDIAELAEVAVLHNGTGTTKDISGTTTFEKLILDTIK